MAESWTIAFGRYLRELRDRRGLSLNEVATLSAAFADDVQKGYLSRVENGRQRLAFSKVIALSRIYEVPADVLLERMELDLELERLGGPETEGKTFGELREAGRESMAAGEYWPAYAYLRDACRSAAADELVEPYTDSVEQRLFSWVNITTAALKIGRFKLVLHELDHVAAQEGLRGELRVLLYERQSVALRHSDRLDEAWEYATRAIELGRNHPRYLAFALASGALTLRQLGDAKRAAEYYQEAHQLFVESEQWVEAARNLTNLSVIYIDLKNFRAARRSLAAAEHKYNELGMRQGIALHRLLLGTVEDANEREDLAEKYWREASKISRELNAKLMQFQADFFLLKLAVRQGKRATSRALIRGLQRASTWLPKQTEEVHEFQAFLREHETRLQRGNTA